MARDHPKRGRRSAGGPVVGQTGARFGGAAGRRSRAAVSPAEDDSAEAAHGYRDDQTPVGQTEVRHPGILNRWRHQQDPDQQDPELTAEDTSATSPPQAPLAVPRPVVAPPASELDRVTGADPGAVNETYELVRPYFWTGGRTESRCELSCETLVSSTGKVAGLAASPEHRTILAICATPHSVAELAALLSMPLGVARVVLGDLADAGSVVVHRTVGSADAAPDIDLMRRVLAGLQRL